MIAAYGVANLLQSIAAARTTAHHTLDPGLLLRLAGHRTYLLGLRLPDRSASCSPSWPAATCRCSWCRPRSPPASASPRCSACWCSSGGCPPPRWPCWCCSVVGIAALVVSAEPAPSRPLGPAGVIALVVALGADRRAGFFAARLHGVPGSVALGSLAGLAFAAAAVAARPLASVASFDEFVRDPLLYLLIAHSLVGQLLLGLAMQRGSTTAAVAAMDAAGAVPAAIVGLLFLGDKIAPGREWLAALGFLVTPRLR